MWLYAIGLGIDCRLHITEQAKQTLRVCSKIFVLNPDTVALSLVRSLNPAAELIDCNKFYRGVKLRPNAYKIIARNVLKACTPHSNIGFVTYGHPMFLVSAVEQIIAKANETKINVQVIPGISSFDTLMSDLQVDPGYGVQIYDATLMLLTKPKINTEIPLIIFQMSNIMSLKIERKFIHHKRLTKLREFLLTMYPSDHKCRILSSPIRSYEPPKVSTVLLKTLDRPGVINLNSRPTLYVGEQLTRYDYKGKETT